MNRRHFLHVLTAIGATISSAEVLADMRADVNIASPNPILKDDDPGNQTVSQSLRVGIIGIGGAGCYMVPKLYSQLPVELVPLTRTLAIDSSLRALRNSQGQSQILLRARRRSANPQSAAILTNIERTSIERAVVGMHLVVILAGMGGTTGSELTPVVTDIAHQQGIATVVAAVMPFEWESASRAEVAHTACETLLTDHQAVGLFQFRIDSTAHICRGDPTLLSALDQACIYFASIYRNLVMAIVMPGVVAVDLDGIRYILSRPGLATCAEAESRNENDLETSAATAISQPWLGAERLRSSSAILVSIEATDSTLTLKRCAEFSRFMRKQCGDDPVLVITVAQREMFGEPFRVSVLASGIG